VEQATERIGTAVVCVCVCVCMRGRDKRKGKERKGKEEERRRHTSSGVETDGRPLLCFGETMASIFFLCTRTHPPVPHRHSQGETTRFVNNP
jgi:hypothetical protein